MIRRVRGNLLEAKTDALVNTVNTVGVMGRGLPCNLKKTFLPTMRLIVKHANMAKSRLAGCLFMI